MPDNSMVNVTPAKTTTTGDASGYLAIKDNAFTVTSKIPATDIDGAIAGEGGTPNDNSVTTSKIDATPAEGVLHNSSANTLSWSKVETSDLADAAVTPSKIAYLGAADYNITEPTGAGDWYVPVADIEGKSSDGYSVTTAPDRLVYAKVTNALIADGAITPNKLDIEETTSSEALSTLTLLSGTADDDFKNHSTIAVDSASIEDGAITSAKITDGAISASKLAISSYITTGTLDATLSSSNSGQYFADLRSHLSMSDYLGLITAYSGNYVLGTFFRSNASTRVPGNYNIFWPNDTNAFLFFCDSDFTVTNPMIEIVYLPK